MRQRPEFCINCEVWYDARRYPLCCPACLQPITERVVLWLDGGSYLLRNVERDNAGFIKRAVVINGEWMLSFNSETWVARASTVRKWNVTKYQELAVPDDMTRSWPRSFVTVLSDRSLEPYSDILRWAERQR